MTTRAKILRQQPTPAEVSLWRLLYPLRTSNFHFRKQSPIGPYVADFACHHAQLVIEVDGETHATQSGQLHDQKRDAFLRAEGYTILRFTNRDVLDNPEGVFDTIASVLNGRPTNVRASAQP